MLNGILLLLVLILINAFFAASEIALISLNDNKIRIMAEEGDKKAGQIMELLGEPSGFLATIQIGITLTGFLASAFAAENFSDHLAQALEVLGLPVSYVWLTNISLVLITIVLSYFTLVLGELVPKRLAMKKAETIAMLVVGPLTFLKVVASPFVNLLTISMNFVVRIFGVDPNAEDEDVTEEEIRMMVDVGEEKGAILEDEKTMINNIFEFNDTMIWEIMTHRTDIFAFPVEATYDEVVAAVNTEKYSRIPVYEGDIDNIIGVLRPKDLLQFIAANHDKNNFDLRKIIHRPFFVPSTMRADVLLKELKSSQNHMAVVIDEYGGTAGIVTLEDLIEEIVGNIFDEDDDAERDFTKLDDKTCIINGSVSLDDVQEYLGVDLPIHDYETLSGFIIGRLGRIPDQGETPSIEYAGLVFKVKEINEKRIVKVIVSRN